MLKLSKLADNAIVILSHLARSAPGVPQTAGHLAIRFQLPESSVRKIVRALTKADILIPHLFVNGGYTLKRSARNVSVAEVITAIDGIPETSETETLNPEDPGEDSVMKNRMRMNAVVLSALDHLTILDMTAPDDGEEKLGQLIPLFGVR